MAHVEVRDNVIWTKHIHGDLKVRAVLEQLPAEGTMTLRVAGELGVWRKMRANATTGAHTPGLQPIGAAATRWRALYKAAKRDGGAVVDIEVPASSPADVDVVLSMPSLKLERASPEERRAAWEAIQDLWRTGGWRSDGAYGSRDELHEREQS